MPAEIGSTVACHHCGGPVTPDEAYILEFEAPDGTTEPVVFHRGLDTLCPLRWGLSRLEALSARLEGILALMKYVDDGRERK